MDRDQCERVPVRCGQGWGAGDVAVIDWDSSMLVRMTQQAMASGGRAADGQGTGWVRCGAVR